MHLATSSIGRQVKKRPQFHLRTLMLSVTGCCVLLGLMKEIGPLGSVGLCFFLVLVVLHAAGNALGTSLREGANRAIEEEQRITPTTATISRDDSISPAPWRTLPASVPTLAASATSRLRERTSLGWMVFVLTGLGAALGGSLGSLAYAYWTDVNVAGLIVGSISAAILGGFFGFLASSFSKIIFRAWRQALEELPRTPQI